MSRFYFIPVMLKSIRDNISKTVIVDVAIGVFAAIASSVIFQIYTDSSIIRTERRKLDNSIGIIRNYCVTFSNWYAPSSQSIDAIQIHRMPGFPDPIVEGAINSLRVIGDYNDSAYSTLTKLSQVYKRDLHNYILNQDSVRQWRAQDYWHALDYVCAWAGVKADLLCAASRTVEIKDNEITMTYYAAPRGGLIVDCDSEEIYKTYEFPDLD